MLSAIESSDAPGARATAEHPLLGKLVEQRYRVVSHIGSGGMADVYEVEHVALGRRLAMKVLRQTRSSNPHLVRRFNREARAASRIESEHVVGIVDYGALAEGQPYFVMELLRGQNLRQLLDAQGPLPVVRAVNIGIDVCLGLHAAHASGLVHRDLKPENLWLSRGDDGRELCVLLDFGVARFDGAHTTGDGVLVGTARYMSPEQIGSENAPGPASDLFSLAVIIYESLTKTAPFAADSLERTLFRILNETPTPVGDINPDVPAELAAVLERAMAKKPEARFATALELAAALRPFAGALRQLPALGLAARSALSDETLAESDEMFEPSVAVGDAAPPERPSAPAAVVRRAPAWLLGFGAGLLLGAAIFFAMRSPPPTQQVPPKPLAPATATPAASAEPADASASMRATPTGVATPPTSAAAPPLAPPSASSSPGRAGVLRARPPTAPSSAVPSRPPSRPEPPRPNFDGRNPYFQ